MIEVLQTIYFHLLYNLELPSLSICIIFLCGLQVSFTNRSVTMTKSPAQVNLKEASAALKCKIFFQAKLICSFISFALILHSLR